MKLFKIALSEMVVSYYFIEAPDIEKAKQKALRNEVDPCYMEHSQLDCHIAYESSEKEKEFQLKVWNDEYKRAN